ncbi:hypothetical protein ACET3Z_025543 [Daucus carota]
MEGMKNNKGEIDEIRRDLKKNLNLQDLNHRYLTQEEIDDGYEILVDDRPRVPSPPPKVSEYKKPPKEKKVDDDDDDEDAALKEYGDVDDLLKLRLKGLNRIKSTVD